MGKICCCFIVMIFILPSYCKFIERDDSWIPRLKKNDLNNFTLVSRIPSTSLYKFNFYRDVSILYYPMPEDVIEATFLYKAHENKMSSLGGSCDPQDIDIYLKAGGFPVVSPQNISFPEDFLANWLRNDITSLKIKSDQSNNTITLYNPVSGDWFGIAFVSWTDPKTDKIEQQGIATVCDTVLYTDLRIKKALVTIKSCDENMQLDVKNTKENAIDFYKFYIYLENTSYTLNLSVISQCDDCQWAIMTIQARSLPDENFLVSCSLDLKNEKSQNLSITFNSYPHEWHYLKMEYGTNQKTAVDVKPCNVINTNEINENVEEIFQLVRDTKSEYFTFDYNLPPFDDNFVSCLKNVSSNTNTILKFDVLPVQDIGGTLTIGISLKLDIKYYFGYKRPKNDTFGYYFTKDDSFIKLVVCLSLHSVRIPRFNNECEFNGKKYPATIVVNNTDASTSSQTIHIPYPEVGPWYISYGLFCDGNGFCPCISEKNGTQYLLKNGKSEDIWMGKSTCNASLVFSVTSNPCIEGKCGKNGACNYYMSGGFIYSTCRCKSGYAGWDCSDASNVPSVSEILASVLLLTLSNLLFIPSIYIAFKRQYYTEAIVYFSTMFFSTFYHACDTDVTYNVCIVRIGVLQYCDFFCGLLSFWVTLVAMAALNNRAISILHMIGAIMIAFGTELNKQALLVFLIPVIIGMCIVAIAWGFRCRKTRKMFPAKTYLIIYVPIGLVLAAIGLICFAFLQTNANYYIVHSVWHMVIALSILCFLPNREIFFPKS